MYLSKKMVRNILEETINGLISKIWDLPIDSNFCWFSGKREKTIWETEWMLFQLMETIWTNKIIETNIEKLQTAISKQINEILDEKVKKALEKFREIKYEKILDKYQNHTNILDKIDWLYEEIKKEDGNFEDLVINFYNCKTIVELNLELFSWEEKTVLAIRLRFYQQEITKLLEKHKSDNKQH